MSTQSQPPPSLVPPDTERGRGRADSDAPPAPRPPSPRAGDAEMEPESLYNLLQLPKETSLPALEELPQGAGPRGAGGRAEGRRHTSRPAGHRVAVRGVG